MRPLSRSGIRISKLQERNSVIGKKRKGSPWNFRVKGSGVILAANTESRASTIDIDLFPPDGTTDLVLQIGPVFKDSAIRDSLDFISFTDFTNQLEFARLSNAFNKVVNQDVTGKLDRENLMGKKISFWGRSPNCRILT